MIGGMSNRLRWILALIITVGLGVNFATAQVKPPEIQEVKSETTEEVIKVDVDNPKNLFDEEPEQAVLPAEAPQPEPQPRQIAEPIEYEEFDTCPDYFYNSLVDTYEVYVNAENIRHENALDDILSEASARGMLYSGWVIEQNSIENAQHIYNLDLLEQEHLFKLVQYGC